MEDLKNQESLNGQNVSAVETNERKKCYRCGMLLPVSEFNKSRMAKDGLQCMCRRCQSEVQRERYSKKVAEITSTSGKGLVKVYAHAELAKFHPRELMEELKARGFRWEYMLEPQKKIFYDKI